VRLPRPLSRIEEGFARLSGVPDAPLRQFGHDLFGRALAGAGLTADAGVPST
jgi:hypothetical protein